MAEYIPADVALEKQITKERAELANWLASNKSSIDGIEKDIASRGGSLDKILRYTAMMSTEIEAGLECARKKDVLSVSALFTAAKISKDRVYGELSAVYGMPPQMNGNAVLWGDYLAQKLNGGLRAAKLHIDQGRIGLR